MCYDKDSKYTSLNVHFECTWNCKKSSESPATEIHELWLWNRAGYLIFEE